MANRRKQTGADDDDDAGLDADGMTAREGERVEEADRDVDSVIAELGEDASYVVLRRFESGDWVILDRLDVGDSSAVAIKSRFGGGKYRARIHDTNGDFRKQVTFKMAGKSKSGDADEPTDARDDMKERLDRLEKLITEGGSRVAGDSVQDKLLSAVVTRIMAVPERPAVDPLMGTLITALINGRPNSSGIDPIKLQELLQTARTDGYNQGKELGEAMGIAEGGGDANIATVLARTLPELAKTFGGAMRTGQRIAAPRPNPPAPAHLPATPAPAHIPVAPSEGNGNVNDPIAQYLRPAVPIILKWARSNKSAEVKAVNMLDDLSEEQRDVIGKFAENDDFVEMVMQAIPEFHGADVDQWCRLFLVTVQNTLAPINEEGANPAGAETMEA